MTGKRDLDRIEILLVDDRPENLLALEAVLSCPEYELVKANSGDEALRYLLTHVPAVILMDVQMPGLDGYETAAIIKKNERTREIPIIFVTAINKEERYVHKGYDYGAVDYIYKPYDSLILRAKVAVLADMRRQQERVVRLVAVQVAVTRALAESSDIQKAIPNVLEAVCGSLEWDLGTFWLFDSRSRLLRCQAEWHSPSRRMSEFLAETFESKYFPGVGLPGKVWTSRKTLWVTDLPQEEPLRGVTAARAGLRTATVLPIEADGEVLGVFEFFSQKCIPEDPHLVKIMGAIGSQVGQVLSRASAYGRIRLEEARKAAILETALDCIISMDFEGRILEFNPAAEITFGHRREDVLGRPLAEVVMPERLREAHRNGLARYLATGESPLLGRRTEMTALRAGGTEFPVELTINRIAGVEPAQFTGFLRDITARKKAEKNAHLLAEASAALSASLDLQERISSLAGLSVQSLADWCVIDVRMEDSELYAVATAHRETEKSAALAGLCHAHPPALWRAGPVYHEILSDADLVDFWGDPSAARDALSLGATSMMAVPLLARGKLVGKVVFVSAASDQHFSESDFAFVQELAGRAALAIDNARLYHDAQVAIRTRDEFFSIASHELKTPITSLKLQLDMTRRQLKPETGVMPPADRLLKMLSTSGRQVDRLTQLVEDLLDVVKIRAGKLSFSLSEFNLSELVSETLDAYSDVLAAAKCPVELEADAGIVGSWDRGRIEQVVSNLLGNAVKYAPGKPLKIKVSRREGRVLIVMRDFGPGIAPDRLPKIFERFERAVTSRSISGLGLGLYIVKQIVEAHHGSVSVESVEGKGTTFTVELPQQSPESAMHEKFVENSRFESINLPR